MKLSEQQEQAVQDVLAWSKNCEHKRHYRLFGYAGTGKTTIAKEIAERHGGEVIFGAFTGKASHVLRSKGCVGACTLHSLIYTPKDKCKERLRELQENVDRLAKIKEPSHEDALWFQQALKDLAEERENVNQPGFSLNLESELRNADLLIIDECSMVGRNLGSHLASFGVPILALGDPAQLPPVKAEYFFRQTEPDTLLTDVHRQALESPVLALATKVRGGNTLTLGDYGSSFVRQRRDVELDEILSGDIILVGRNTTRHDMNDLVRRHRFGKERESFWEDAPFDVGESLVCLKNNRELGLMNGAIYKVEEVRKSFVTKTIAVIRSEDTGAVVEAHIANDIFYGGNMFDCDEGITYFDFGYALTCHKSQGSQWKNVVVFNESEIFRTDATKWLYTAITRASESVKVVA